VSQHAEAEVERLQARLDSLMEAHFAQPDPKRLELEAEVERLREDVDKAWAEADKRIEAAWVENERLRQEVGVWQSNYKSAQEALNRRDS
jgi:Skp family chaperone for outer membrane proteins